MNPRRDLLNQPDGLAQRLRELRLKVSPSSKAFAERLSWAPSKVSRLEGGQQMPSPGDVDAWARAVMAEPAVAQELMGLLEEVQSAHRDWRRRMARGQAAVQDDYLRMEREAQRIRFFELVWVPGPLQTHAYARRAHTEMAEMNGPGASDIDAAVDARMRRQQLLYDGSARQWQFLIDESVLYRLLIPPAETRLQFDRLQSVIGATHIDLGVLPFGVVLSRTPQNSFQIFDDQAMVEDLYGERPLDEDKGARSASVFDELWAVAAVGEGARRLIVAAADALPTEP